MSETQPMTGQRERTRARLEFALRELERHRADIDAAVAALRRVEAMRHRADIALTVSQQIVAEELAAEETEFRARLGVDMPQIESASVFVDGASVAVIDGTRDGGLPEIANSAPAAATQETR